MSSLVLPVSCSEVVGLNHFHCISKCNSYDTAAHKVHDIVYNQCSNCCTVKMVMAYRYVILVWQNGSNRQQRRPALADGVAQLLTWHQKCLEMPTHLGQSNMTFTVLALFCGNSYQKRHLLKMVQKLMCLMIYGASCY